MTATVAAAPAVLQDRNHDLGSLITFAAQGAGTVNSARMLNQSALGVKVVINVTAISGTSPTLAVTIEGYDNASGVAFTVLASANLTAIGTTVLTVYPTVAAVANVAANDHLPATWDIKTVIGGTTPSVTATIGAQLLR